MQGYGICVPAPISGRVQQTASYDKGIMPRLHQSGRTSERAALRQQGSGAILDEIIIPLLRRKVDEEGRLQQFG